MTLNTTEPVRHRGYDALALIGWILTIVAAGAAAGIFFAPESWYAALRKPAFNPPNGIFGPVWTALYVLMAVALWLVRREQDAPPALRSRASRWFAAQFLFNLLWAPLFFGLRSPLLAVVDIGLCGSHPPRRCSPSTGCGRSPPGCCCRIWCGSLSPRSSMSRSGS